MKVAGIMVAGVKVAAVVIEEAAVGTWVAA
jgi:hypothetical protein